MKPNGSSWTGVLFLSLTLGLCPRRAAPQETDAWTREVKPFLAAHCARCHNPEKKKGKFDLAPLSAEMASHRAAYASILERLQAGDMPPDGETRPGAVETGKVVAWIREGLARSPVAGVSDPLPLRPNEGNALPHSLLFGSLPGKVVPPPPRLWRLRPLGYSEGFLGSFKLRNSKDLPQPFDLIPDSGIKDFAALYAVDGPGTEVLVRNARRIVESQLESVDLTAPTPEQLKKLMQTQFRLALVREPSAEEVDRLLALYRKNLQSVDPKAAAAAMLMAPLLSPEATHRFELGRGPEVRQGVRMLSPQEIAFAVSLTFGDRREPGLFDAAAKGGLGTREEVATQVRRILDDPKVAKPRVLGFFREYFGYGAAPEVFKDKPADILHAPEQMVRDTDQLVLYILERDKDVLRELLTTRKAFVNFSIRQNKAKEMEPKRGAEAHPVNDKGRRHPEAVYGMDDWTPDQPVDLPEGRIGILMQPSWLVAWSLNFDNDPVRRGRFIRERLLGGRVPDLPLGVDAKVPDEPHRTLRDRMRVTREPECWKCHQRMDDLGLPFEQFDPFGKFRTTEAVVDPALTARNVDKKGKILGPVRTPAPLVTTGAIAASGDPALDGPIASPVELVRRLAGSERVRQVFVRHVFRYVMGRNETAGDAATLQAADQAYVESGGSFRSLLISLVSSESFLYRRVSP